MEELRSKLTHGSYTEACLGESIYLLLLTAVILGFDAKRFGYDKLCAQLLAQRDRWESYGAPWMKVVKYQRDAYFAHHRSQPLPSKPFPEQDNPSLILAGGLGRWVNALKTEKSGKGAFTDQPGLAWTVWITTVQNGWKGGCPRPTKEDVEEEVRSTFKQLTEKEMRDDEVSIPDELCFDVTDWDHIDYLEGEYAKHKNDLDITSPWHPIEALDAPKVDLWGDEEVKFEDKRSQPPGPALWNGKITKERFILELRRTAAEALQHAQPLSRKDRIAMFQPSTSSSYYSSRSEFGPLGEIYEDKDLSLGLKTSGGAGWKEVESKVGTNTDYFLSGAESPALPLQARDPLEEPELFKMWFEDNEEDEEIASEKVVIPSRRDLKHRFMILRDRLLDQALAEENNVSLVGLPEALKVRVISKGPGKRGTVLKATQKWMHSNMRVHPIFRLIGETISAEYLQNQLGKLAAGEEYGSGDYKAATNKMRKFVSHALGEMVADKMALDGGERSIFLDALTRHSIEDPENPGVFREQTVGQLMGSIVSFPLLCLANATIMRVSFEIATGRVWTLAELPVAINGDDVTWRGVPEIYKVWQIVAGFAGMEESVGKTFTSREFVQMNSRHYDVVSNVFVAAQFIPWGLVTGQQRAGGGTAVGEGDDERQAPGPRYRAMVEMSPPETHLALHKIYKDLNADALKDLRVPWYIPEWLGGLGLTGIMEPSDHDLAIANRFIIDFSAVAKQGRINDRSVLRDLPKNAATPVASWKIRDIAARRLPAPFMVRVENEGVSRYERAVFEEGINLLFDSDLTMSDLHVDNGLNGAIKHNRALWKRAYSKDTKQPLKRAPIRFRGQELEKLRFFQSYNHFDIPWVKGHDASHLD